MSEQERTVTIELTVREAQQLRDVVDDLTNIRRYDIPDALYDPLLGLFTLLVIALGQKAESAIRHAKDPEIDDAISRLVVCAYRRTQAEGGDSHTECDYWANEQWAAREALVDKIESGPASDRDRQGVSEKMIQAGYDAVFPDYGAPEEIDDRVLMVIAILQAALAAGTEPR